MFTQNKYDKKYFESMQDYLPDTIFDAHVHLWKKEHILNSEEGCVAGWVANFIGGHIMNAEQYKETCAALFPGKKMQSMAFGWVEANIDLESNNAYIGSLAPDINGLAVVRPDWSAEYTIDQVEKNGLFGLKPYPDFAAIFKPANEVRVTDMLTKDQLAAANEKGWTVVIHLPRAGRLADKCNIEDLLMIDREYPNIKVVVAHIGRAYAMQNIGDAFDALKDTKHLVFDFAAHTNADVFKETIKVFGTDRIHYGSDMPISGMRLKRTYDENGTYINIVPRGSCGDVTGDPHMLESDAEDISYFCYEAIAAMIAAAKEMGLKDSRMEDIFFNNAKKLVER